MSAFFLACQVVTITKQGLDHIVQDIRIEIDRIPMHFVHMIGRGDSPVHLTQKLSTHRLTFQVGKQSALTFKEKRKAFLAHTMAHSGPFRIKRIVLIHPGKGQTVFNCLCSCHNITSPKRYAHRRQAFSESHAPKKKRQEMPCTVKDSYRK